MTDLSVKALDDTTWNDFARLVEKHNGVWGGCWCMAFHPEGIGRGKTPAQNRCEKQVRVHEGRAHAALVYHDTVCVGWCQFGSPQELSRIGHRRAYEAELIELPDWRITCFFVDKEHRRQGVARVALKGALHAIARLGGGTVESYPEDAQGRSLTAGFLHNGTVAMFEREGFERTRRLGKNHWVVHKRVRKSSR